MAVLANKTFFSYARVDSEFVLRLATDLRSAGANIWVDQLEIPAGERWDGAVESALKSCGAMVVVLSPEAVTSNNVLDEIAFALERNKKIIPIIHRKCEVPFRLGRLQYIDFTADFGKGLIALLAALGVAKQPAPSPAPHVTSTGGYSAGSGGRHIAVKGADPVTPAYPVSTPDRGQISSSSSILQNGLAYLIVFGIPVVLILLGSRMVANYYPDAMSLRWEDGSVMLTSETMLFVYLGVVLNVAGVLAGVFILRSVIQKARS
jgi:TIR domain